MQIYYYINLSINNNLNRNDLRKRIQSHEYERLPEKAKEKMIKSNKELEDISSFMKELGEGYSFIDQEYKIKLRKHYHYIDLLLN